LESMGLATEVEVGRWSISAQAEPTFAMRADGLGFQLVPWQPVLEKRLDHYISGVRRDDGGIEWSFTRNRQIGLGL
ncbi:MAG: DUF3363 domain-containing protein, partial [Proteobacteria bacterium]|nr:DUF3363 domain-containing protein [Pseudomonadota bacterium]